MLPKEVLLLQGRSLLSKVGAGRGGPGAAFGAAIPAGTAGWPPWEWSCARSWLR